jgi:hypothetical protein
MIARLWSKENFAAHDLNRLPTDAYVNYTVIALRGANEDPAGALHFDTLFNEDTFIRLGDAMCHHPGHGTTSR